MHTNYQADSMPLHQSIRIDDEQCGRSAYLEVTEVQFECHQFSTGSKSLREAYEITKEIKKYFARRRFLFSRFDSGILLDHESWYSVVAQPISQYICENLKYYGVKTVFEPFCGVGGVAVHLCDQFVSYIANDIDEEKIKMLKNNLMIYDKSLNSIKIKNEDLFDLQPFKVDAVIICPPWGGMDVSPYQTEELDTIMEPPLSKTLLHCAKFSSNMIIQMPKNTNLFNFVRIINMCFLKPIIRVEKVVVNGKTSQLLIYIGGEEFLHVNPELYNTILTDSGRVTPMNSKKPQKKHLKEQLANGENTVFEEIFTKKQAKQKKHIFFDQ